MANICQRLNARGDAALSKKAQVYYNDRFVHWDVSEDTLCTTAAVV
jgi:hypothetical protein